MGRGSLCPCVLWGVASQEPGCLQLKEQPSLSTRSATTWASLGSGLLKEMVESTQLRWQNSTLTSTGVPILFFPLVLKLLSHGLSLSISAHMEGERGERWWSSNVWLTLQRQRGERPKFTLLVLREAIAPVWISYDSVILTFQSPGMCTRSHDPSPDPTKQALLELWTPFHTYKNCSSVKANDLISVQRSDPKAVLKEELLGILEQNAFVTG